MAFTASTMLQLLVVVTWTLLSITPTKSKRALFSHLLPDQAVLSEMVSATGFAFCPGLFNAIQAAGPPPLSFFLGLPSDSVQRWGIYVLVLDKPAAVPLIYIGSGTASKGGVQTRFLEYDRDVHVSRYVRNALNNGYTIVHKGLLLWSPIPPVADIPRSRVLFVAIEAAMSFLFWAMKSQNKDYGMSEFCPWSRDSFSYRGLCSHNPLSDAIAGDFNLTSEALEAIAAETKEKLRVYNAEHHQNFRARSPDRFYAQRRKNDANFKKNAPDKVRKNHNASCDRAKANKKYYCAICDVSCRKNNALTAHKATPRHLKKVAEAESSSRST